MSGGIAGRGQPGKRGPPGPTGPTGPQGPAAFSLAVGAVTAVPYGGTPSVENVGTDQDQIWNIAVPTGATGVLVGDSPPTGSDGTSLGQLYYCTTNQSYYGLIELNENDNKWRPIMTQDTAIRTYRFDLLWGSWDSPLTHVGTMNFLLDDVKQKCCVSVDLRGAIIPVGGRTSHIYVDARARGKLKADCLARGITNVPVPAAITVNNQTVQATVNLLADNWIFATDGTSVYAAQALRSVAASVPPIAPSGSMPGAVAAWENGVVVLRENTTAAPGATEYGNVPVYQENDTHEVFGVSSVAEYTVSTVVNAVVEVPYVAN